MGKIFFLLYLLFLFQHSMFKFKYNDSCLAVNVTLKFANFQAIGKGFQDLPPEVIGIIMGYCSTEDKKEMRCVSKWYESKSKKLFQT